MSNLERQRILREAGTRPAQAEKEESAAESKQAFGQERAQAAGEQSLAERDLRPLAEDDDGPPRPRR
jgi:hypothetical protein